MDYRYMTNRQLVDAEAALDFRDPDILTEIFHRAEEFEPGITALYESSFSSTILSADEIFDRAVSYLV